MYRIIGFIAVFHPSIREAVLITNRQIIANYFQFKPQS